MQLLKNTIKTLHTLTSSVKAVKRNELTKLGQELSGRRRERIQQALQQRQQELLGPINKKAYEAAYSL